MLHKSPFGNQYNTQISLSNVNYKLTGSFLYLLTSNWALLQSLLGKPNVAFSNVSIIPTVFNWRKCKKKNLMSSAALLSVISKQIYGHFFTLDIWDNNVLRQYKSHWIISVRVSCQCVHFEGVVTPWRSAIFWLTSHNISPSRCSLCACCSSSPGEAFSFGFVLVNISVLWTLYPLIYQMLKCRAELCSNANVLFFFVLFFNV